MLLPILFHLNTATLQLLPMDKDDFLVQILYNIYRQVSK